MAVAIDGGLITPTIRQCQNKGLLQIGREWKDLVDKAKEKKLKPDVRTYIPFMYTNNKSITIT